MKPIIDSRQLLAFFTLARTSSFTLAAKELFLTQSAISHAIKAMEQELGVLLFERMGKKAHLTQAGEQLLMHAERILREMQDARMGMEELTQWGHSRLRVGASTSTCQYLLPTVLREFKQSFPKCVIRIESGDGPKMLDMLHTNQIDLAVMLRPLSDKNVDFHPLFTDTPQFFVSPSHRWAQAGKVAKRDMAEETFILYNKSSYTFTLVEDHLRRDAIVLKNYMELGSMEAIKELVKIGLGVGILAPWIATKELAEGSLVSFALGTSPLKREWGVCHLKGRRLALAEETFVGLCESVSEGLS